MAKQIEFTAKNVKAFTSWLKKFSLVDNTLLLEINQSTKEFIAKIYNEERSVVKFSKIKFDEAGFLVKNQEDNYRIKLGIYNIPKLIKTLDHFNDDEFSFIFKYEEVLSDKETEYAGTNMLLKNKNLKISIECTSLNIFKYLPDELFINTISAINPLVKFDLQKSNIEKINSLSDLDKDYKFIKFINKDKSIYVRSKTFELKLAVSNNVEAKLNILKDQFNKIDLENYSVKLGEDRMIFNSLESDTITVVSIVEEDERYSETEHEF